MVLYIKGAFYNERIDIMKRFLSILLTAASLFAFTSCSERTELPADDKQPYSQPPEAEKVVWLEKDLDDDPEEDVNFGVTEGNTHSKDFDGVLLTVTTDKAEYKLGEEINLTSSVKNNTEETIEIYVSTSTKNSHKEISTWMRHDEKYLFDPDAPMFVDFGTAVVKLDPGEEYVQNERRITFIYKDDYHTDEDFELAPAGEYECCSAFYLLNDSSINSKGKTCWVNYSITLTEPDEPVELYRFPPREDHGLYTLCCGYGVSLEAHTEKSVYRPGEPVTVEIILDAFDSETELLSGSCGVYTRGAAYPWVFEENIIEKKTFPEGVKVEQGSQLKQSFTFECLTEPGEYVLDFSADHRLPDGSIDNISFFIVPLIVSSEELI